MQKNEFSNVKIVITKHIMKGAKFKRGWQEIIYKIFLVRGLLKNNDTNGITLEKNENVK